jgi:organic radical activating enzyme
MSENINHKNKTITGKKQSQLQCRLKWALSTVFLTTNTTASCHRCDHNPITEDFDFHNTHQKVHARLQMLRNEWPELGCEHCRVIEQAGGMSDRLLHDDIAYAPSSPPELLEDPKAVHVTPTQLEIYFSNLCQLSCTYCGSYFSSTWETEDKNFGSISKFMHPDEGDSPDNDFQELKYLDKTFEWLDKNGHHLRHLYILGGEPFIQPQSDRLLDFIENSGDKFKNLKLFFFSNLSTDKAIGKIDRIVELADSGKIWESSFVGSIDCWGKQAEYVRFGLDTEMFDKNMKYMVSHKSSRINVGINLCWSNISTFTMPELVDKYQEWTELSVSAGKPWGINISLMQVGGKPWMHPKIFGKKVLDWGYNDALDKMKNMDIPGCTNDINTQTFEYFEGIKKSIEECQPNKKAQQDLHRYLTELDRRRGTDYRELFPVIYEEIHKQ